ncbi:cysteine desulfurase family protein [Kroppenstedtia eburnea]|uniref:cysteine desulfurase n=1 Tax=Kroppenstedtia eburnea TaxID=714067 RepID=A0A1N7KLV7_9BACL|nr:cysteine desulfurase family protein [Kroppenstedtia eburnea]EGK12287.1 cysteine desulfurase [Desmospora sp. 8437]QKI82913.1 cysteine desulfurase [Kroppenstedtia eburnea]SIS62557.1 cysteine desulfurase [Kroppenstedtia eburnea]
MMAIYLDHAATTPVYPRVKEAMLPFLGEKYGNPSSIHGFGREIRNAVDRARDQVARGLNADPGQLIFTSGGTEADNLALTGVALALREQGKDHVITSQVEHHAVLDTCEFLERFGFRVTRLPVDETGQVSPEKVREALDEETAILSIMYGNNEVGTLQPVAEIGEIAREHGVFFHTDAVQAFGMEKIDVKSLPVDLLTVSAHKINGPKGVGALWIGRNVPLQPLQHGGLQEKRRRAGTENVPGIVGFGEAAELAILHREEHRQQTDRCRQAMLEELDAADIRYHVNGHPEHHLPHILNLSFPGADTEVMLMNLDLEGVACASGSACTSGTLEISHVLEAMGLPEDRLRSAIRFSFGMGNTEEEVRIAAQRVAKVVRRLTAE